MAVAFRLSRGGSKKRPFFRIVAADLIYFRAAVPIVSRNPWKRNTTNGLSGANRDVSPVSSQSGCVSGPAASEVGRLYR